MFELFEGLGMATVVVFSPVVISMLILSRKQSQRSFDDRLAEPRD